MPVDCPQRSRRFAGNQAWVCGPTDLQGSHEFAYVPIMLHNVPGDSCLGNYFFEQDSIIAHLIIKTCHPEAAKLS